MRPEALQIGDCIAEILQTDEYGEMQKTMSFMQIASVLATNNLS
jgi:hypothetical protein